MLATRTGDQMIAIVPETPVATPATPEPYTGPERRAEPGITKDEHARVCSMSERRINERFAHIYERFGDGVQRMARIEESVGRLEATMTAAAETTDTRMDRVDAGLQQNTAVTQEVKDILDTAKGAFRFFGHLGNALKWALGLGGAALGFWVALKDFRAH